jgi:hypothetical protein
MDISSTIIPPSKPSGGMVFNLASFPSSAKHPDLFLPVDEQYFCIFATVVGKAIS